MKCTRLYVDFNWDKFILWMDYWQDNKIKLSYVYDTVNSGGGPFIGEDSAFDKDTPSYSTEITDYATDINDITTSTYYTTHPDWLSATMWSEKNDSLIIQGAYNILSPLVQSIEHDLYVESYTITNDATQLDASSDIRIEWVDKRLGINYDKWMYHEASMWRITAKKSLFTPVGTDNIYSGTFTLKEANLNITQTVPFQIQLLLASDMNQP